jgi:hypothetical protein
VAVVGDHVSAALQPRKESHMIRKLIVAAFVAAAVSTPVAAFAGTTWA